MNTPVDPTSENLRYAEYVLGVLDADARARVEHEVERDRDAAAAVMQWQRHLLPLSEDIAPRSPPDYVWARIRDALGLAAVRPTFQEPAATSRPERGWWYSLPLWRWLGIGATLAFAASLFVLFLIPVRETAAPSKAAPAPVYMAATIQQNNGATGWTATMDLNNHRMIVVPASPAAMPHGHAPELWLIPPGGKPMSVAMIARDKATTIDLNSLLVAQLGPKATLAVSVEPDGGSPTGQPTGPVVAKGSIGKA